jgi:hypothetical protein
MLARKHILEIEQKLRHMRPLPSRYADGGGTIDRGIMTWSGAIKPRRKKRDARRGREGRGGNAEEEHVSDFPQDHTHTNRLDNTHCKTHLPLSPALQSSAGLPLVLSHHSTRFPFFSSHFPPSTSSLAHSPHLYFHGRITTHAHCHPTWLSVAAHCPSWPHGRHRHHTWTETLRWQYSRNQHSTIAAVTLIYNAWVSRKPIYALDYVKEVIERGE